MSNNPLYTLLLQRFDASARKFWLSGLVVLLFNAGGILAYLIWGKELLAQLSAFNLLLMAALVLINQEQLSKKVALVLSSVVVIGFTAEWLGVHTGLLFGDYAYADTLGISLFSVPLIIGINWAMVVLGAYTVASLILSSKWFPLQANKSLLTIVLAASLATFFDYLLEPVAIHLNFWQWEGGSIPLYNYASWFMVSFVALTLLTYLRIAENRMAAIVLFAQTIFLAGIGLLIRW